MATFAATGTRSDIDGVEKDNVGPRNEVNRRTYHNSENILNFRIVKRYDDSKVVSQFTPIF